MHAIFTKMFHLAWYHFQWKFYPKYAVTVIFIVCTSGALLLPGTDVHCGQKHWEGSEDEVHVR